MEGGKKTKLKKMKITSVDMVHRGANQDAHINLYKSERASPEAAEPPKPDEIPQGLWESIVTAIKGFITQPGRFDDEPDEIEKGESESVQETDADVQKSLDLYAQALDKSIESIEKAEELDEIEKGKLIKKSVDQYTEACKELCAKMLNASQIINKATTEPADNVSNSITPEGDRDMKIDKSRFTPDELSQYEALIAKGLVEDEPENEPENEPKVDPVKARKEMDDDDMPVEKGMHPEVAKALAELEEMKKNMAMDQMKSIAKKYTPLGKKEDELAETLYNMKKSGDSSFNEYIAVLDQNLELVNKSAMYEEIGKSGRTYAGGGATVDRIESIATEIQKSEPMLSRPQAIMKAWEQHPELIAEYDREYTGGR